MDIHLIKQQIMTALTEAQTLQDTDITEIFTSKKMVGQIQRCCIAVGVDQAEHAVDGTKLVVSLTIYAPLDQGVQLCETVFVKVVRVIEQLQLTGYQSMIHTGVAYNQNHRAYCLQSTIHMGNAAETVVDTLQFNNVLIGYSRKALNVYNQRMLKTYYAPYVGEIVQDLGRRARIVTGSGVFSGELAQSQYNDLYQLYCTHSIGTLLVTTEISMHAIFSMLKLNGRGQDGSVFYSFVFKEVLA